MIPSAFDPVEGLFQHGAGLFGPGPFCDAARLQIPHLPGRLVHDRFDEDRTYIGIVGVGSEYLSHLDGEGLVPRHHVVDWFALRVPGLERLDQGPFARRRACDLLESPLHCIVGRGQRVGAALRVVKVPGQIVIRSQCVSGAPVRHGASWIRLDRSPEAGRRLAMVITVKPVQTPVEPGLACL